MRDLAAAATVLALLSTGPAGAFGMPLCRDAKGLFDGKAASGWTTTFMGLSDGGRATYLSTSPDGRFEVIAEPWPSVACLILSGSRSVAQPPSPPPAEQREG